MRIGGFVKQSLIDWDGKICAVIFTKGCNFRCDYCHNKQLVFPSLYNKNVDIDPEFIIQHLVTRSRWLDGVVITGGEPTIQEDLPDFICSIKNLGLKVKLDTNGSNPEMLKRLLCLKLPDYIAMDIKTILNPISYGAIIGFEDITICNKVDSSLKILEESGIPFELRTTIIPGYHSAEIQDYLKLKFSQYNYKFQEFRYF